MKVSVRKILVIAAMAGCAAVQATPLADFNGGFESREDGLSPSRGWSLEVNTSGDAAAKGTVDSTSGTAKEGKNFYHIEVTAVSSENWHVQLKDPTWKAVKGNTYHISMWIRADAAHHAQLSVYGGPEGKDSYRTSSGIELSTEWEEFHQIFVADTEGNGAINFALVCGFEVGTYDIDGVVLDEDTVKGNFYPNSGFEAKGAGWNLWVSDDSTGGAAAMTFPEEGAYDGTRFGRVTVTEAASDDYKVQLQDGTWTSEMDKEYVLTFFAKADAEVNITVAAQAGESRDYAYLFGQPVSLATEWFDFEFHFVPEDTLKLGGPDSISFVFYLGAEAGVYDFDDVRLQLGTATRHDQTKSHVPSQPHLFVRLNEKNMVVTTGQRAVQPFSVDLFNIQGRRLSTYTIAPKGTSFSLPRPPSGTWVVRSGEARTAVIVP